MIYITTTTAITFKYLLEAITAQPTNRIQRCFQWLTSINAGRQAAHTGLVTWHWKTVLTSTHAMYAWSQLYRCQSIRMRLLGRKEQNNKNEKTTTLVKEAMQIESHLSISLWRKWMVAKRSRESNVILWMCNKLTNHSVSQLADVSRAVGTFIMKLLYN